MIKLQHFSFNYDIIKIDKYNGEDGPKRNIS